MTEQRPPGTGLNTVTEIKERTEAASARFREYRTVLPSTEENAASYMAESKTAKKREICTRATRNSEDMTGEQRLVNKVNRGW
jgi:hypothetical protein